MRFFEIEFDHTGTAEALVLWESPETDSDSDSDSDYSNYAYYTPELLAQILFNEAFIGIKWDGAEPDTSDERYRRCLLAADSALQALWDRDDPFPIGEPLGSPAASIIDIYSSVGSFVEEKVIAFFEDLDQGLSRSDRCRMVRSCGAAARRAIASLFGEAASLEAERQFDLTRAGLHTA